MRNRIDLSTKTPAQRSAFKRIHEIYNLMLGTWDAEYLFDLYCEADDLWNEHFPFEAAQYGDDWWVTKRFNDLNREIRTTKLSSVTINVFGCNVTMNVNGVDTK